MSQESIAMRKLSRDDLLGLEQYAAQRAQFRARVIAHKKARVVHVGEHASLHFEDRLTMQYQVQEMLRAERIFEAAGIEEELAAYNPLIPDGGNWKATFMIEYEDVNERARALRNLRGVEDRVWVRVAGHDPVWAIADEDLERTDEEKTSSVHFLRFELSPEMVKAARAGAALSLGIAHPHCDGTVDPLPQEIRDSLVADLG